jgi:hypothetical protein
MAGLLVPLFSMRRFEFNGLTVSTTADLVIVRAYPVFAYREATVLVKVHSLALGGGASIAVLAVEASPTEDAPGVDFTASSVVFSASVTTASTPLLIDASNSTEFGGHLQILVRGTRGSSGSCEAVLEADLVLKE